jgi:hypothetical protein
MAIVSLDSPLCEVPCLILHSVVYRDVTRQAKGLYRLKYDGALKSGLVYMSRCNSGWFCHSGRRQRGGTGQGGSGARAVLAGGDVMVELNQSGWNDGEPRRRR